MTGYILDNVIKQLDKDSERTFVPTNARRLVHIEARTRTILERKPVVALGQTIVSFAVFNSESTAHVAESTISNYMLKDFAKNLGLGLTIRYRVTCPRGNEKMAVRALFEDGQQPGSVFEERVIRTFDKIFLAAVQPANSSAVSTLELFCEGDGTILDRIRLDVEAELKLQTGLVIHLAIELSNTDKLDAQDYRGSIEVMACDSEEKITVEFATRLVVDRQKQLLALLHYGTLHRLDQRIEIEITDWLRQNAKMDSLVYSFDTTIRSPLVSYLNQILGRVGRRVDYLSVKSDALLRMPQISEIEFDVHYNVPEYGIVVIRNRLAVEPDISQLSKYRNAAQTNSLLLTDLAGVLKSYLKSIVERVMFGRSYIDVLKRFDESRSRIESEMESAVYAIGYKINLITSVPDLEPLVWQKSGFAFETESQRNEYATHINHVKVKLNLKVSGKIQDLGRIESLLNRKVDVPAYMCSQVSELVAKLLHETDPEDFYLYFNYIPPGSNKRALREIIQDEVTALLETKFGVDEITITPVVLDTELTDRIRNLRGKVGNFRVEIRPLRDLAATVKFQARFRVEEVVAAQWHTFLTRVHDIDDIEAFLSEILASKLKTLLSDEIIYREPKHHQMLLAAVNRIGSEAAADEFGLAIKVTIIDRLETDGEESWAEAYKLSTSVKTEQAVVDLANQKQLASLTAAHNMQDIEVKRDELLKVRAEIAQLSVHIGMEEDVRTLENREKKLQDEIAVLLARLKNEHLPPERTIESLAPRFSRANGPSDYYITALNELSGEKQLLQEGPGEE